MPIETINFNGTDYPALQAKGFASKFAFPFAQEICKGVGVDIGYSKPEWKLPGAKGIDLGKVCDIDGKERLYEEISAVNFVDSNLDYIFSSHCLEHLHFRIGDVLEYWLSKIKSEGIIFMYLPNCDDQDYWAFENKKHIHYLSPMVMIGVCGNLKMNKLIRTYMVTSGSDLNSSFYCLIEKL